MTDQARGEMVPGGLALVKGLKSSPADNGRIVTTVERAFYGHVAEDGVPFFSSEDCWYCTAEGLSTLRADDRLKRTGYAYFHTKNLMPINPEADPLSIDQRQECEA